ncbi:MAG TPA: phosphate acyltransferase PlsX [Gemmatimonadales bacterium]|nr:phosphate acyltransferase PlsX [Gemmatimonadales bacterium]
MIRVAIDAMGGDNAPAVEVDGVALALSELAPGFRIVLVGRPDVITPHLDRHPGLDRSRIDIVPATEVVAMTDRPLQAVRQKRDSSLVVGIGVHAKGGAEAFVSAGNTGAVLAASTVLLGLHEGVDRATVASHFPTPTGPVLVLDAGANVECSARELVNFAHLGSIYMRDVLHRPNPKVGLLNVGEEEEKGTAIIREAHQALKLASRLNYVGNIEGRDIVVPHPVHGKLDVVVCDGFTGNVVLKFYESMGRLVQDLLERESPGLLKSAELRPLTRFLDYGEYGGAPLLGVRGVPIICHGSSTPLAIQNAIRTAIESVEGKLTEHIAAEMAALA